MIPFLFPAVPLRRVILPTLVAAFLAGCSSHKPLQGTQCNNRAYLRTPLQEVLARTFQPSPNPPRLAVVPFSAPENVSMRSDEFPGVGNRLAWEVQAEILRWGLIGMVEVFHRESWPGKREEFYTGNFGALSRARQAGYDLLLVGDVVSPRNGNEVRIQGKLLTVNDGVTLWYGEIVASTSPDVVQEWWDSIGRSSRTPNMLPANALYSRAARCLVNEIMSDEPVPG